MEVIKYLKKCALHCRSNALDLAQSALMRRDDVNISCYQSSVKVWSSAVHVSSLASRTSPDTCRGRI